MSKFIVKAEELSAALNLLLTVTETKGTIPVLAFTLLELADHHLRLSATDIGRSIITEIEVAGDEPFSLCVQTKRLRDLIGLLQGNVKISQQKNGLGVVAGTSRHLLPTMEADKFPLIQEAEGGIDSSVSGQLLSEMLSTVSFAVGRNPNLERWCQTLLLEATGGTLSITACNGPQLANAQTPFDGELQVVIGQDGVKPLMEIASKAGSLTLVSSDRFLTARAGKTSLSLQLSTYQWPDWKMLLRPSYSHSAEFEVEALRLALKRSVLSCDEHLSVRGVNFEMNKETVSLAASGQDRGESVETVAVQCPSLNGDGATVRLAGDLLLELLRTLKTGTALWQFGDGATPRFTLKERGAFDFQYLQNPLRL